MTHAGAAAAPPKRRKLARIGRTPLLWGLVAAIAAAAIALYAFEVDQFSPTDGQVRIPWWALAVAFYLAEAFVVHLQFRREAHTLSFSEFALVLGLVFAAPHSLVIGQAVGGFAALAIHRRQRPIKVAFNVAQFVLTTCIAVIVFDRLGGDRDPERPLEWIAAFLAALSASAAGVVLVAAAITLAAGEMTVRSLGRVGAVSLVGTAVNTSLALVAVTLIQTSWASAALLALPLAACFGIYRVYTVHRRNYDHLEFLYGSMRSIQEAPDFAAAVRQVLASVRRLVQAEFAEVLLLSREGSGRAVRSTLGQDRDALLQPSMVTPLERVAVDVIGRSSEGLVIGRRQPQSELDGYLVERGLKDAIVTVLRGEDGIFGLLVIGDRAGEVDSFGEHDRKLCETFAGHAAALLENDRLEQSIAELTALKEQLLHQAYHDSLTGLPNRAMFTERVSRALERREEAAVLFLDLDDFKTVNDSLGHSFGDELLQVVAGRVRGCTRREDTPARIGGDEFAILVVGSAVREVEQLAHRLVTCVKEPMRLGGRQVALNASIGIAYADAGVRSADELLQNADVAMYATKARGKRGYTLYEPQMHQLVRRRHELSTALERALEQNEIDVYYQPIVDLNTGRPVAVEALARWHHPERGTVSPDVFIPLAVETGLMVPIGQVVLREACRQTATWRRQTGLRDLSVTVNLSAGELLNPALVGDVAGVLDDTGLPADCLSLEITESGAMQELETAVARTEALRALGVRLALDDFGTGYSSLSHLSRLPIDVVKVAKDFVDRLEDGQGGVTFVETIIRLAAALRLETVAEGVETRGQAELLARLGCRLGQGFHFAEPLTAGDVARYLRTGLRLVA